MPKDAKGHGSNGKGGAMTAAKPPRAKTERYLVKMAGNGRMTAIMVKAKSVAHAEGIAKKDPAFGKQYTQVQAKLDKR